MPWSIAAPVIGAVATSALSSGGGGSSGGGAGSGTSSKEPWAPIQPWLLNNAVQGQNLQAAYTAQPFSNAQNQAYANQGNQSNYMRALVPGLLGQLSGQQLGYDRNNQNARPQAFDFASGDTLKGLLAQMANGANNSSPMQNTPQVQPQQEDGNFMQQADVLNGANGTMGASGLLGTGSYGTFKYGMPTPQPGTQEYRDMSAYFSNGGTDPNNIYGRQATAYQMPPSNPLSRLWTSGYGFLGGAPGEGEGPSSGAPGGAASSGPAGTF
jgi:hypothetical protein